MNTFFLSIFSSLLLYLFSTRLLYWLSIWQQKEYRIDRLWSFVKDNKKTVFITSFFIIPLSPKSLKRPRFTPKIILISLASLAIILFSVFVYKSYFSAILSYLLIPFFILISTLPFNLITLTFTYYYQAKAVALFTKHKPKVIGITGSYGKTTTKLILSAILKTQIKTWNSPKSHNTPLSLPKAIVETYKGEPLVVLEFAAYKKGEIKRLAKLFPPDMAILTGITHQHEAIFGSFENLIKAKSELPDALKNNSLLVFNNHDKSVQKIVDHYPNLVSKQASLSQITDPKINSHGELSFKYQNQLVQTKLIGKHYLSNIQTAVVMSRELGIKAGNISKSLEAFSPSSEFVRSYKTKSGHTVIDDGKSSNPEGFESAIELAAEITNKNKILISPGIIDLGAISDSVHKQLAHKSNLVFNRVIHTSDIGEGPLKHSLGKKYYKIGTTEQLSQSLIDLSANSLIVIEGRVPRVYQQVIDNL